ncbi:MAG: GNAT family N-acetyltransferase [Hyphomicrobiales bacterium]
MSQAPSEGYRILVAEPRHAEFLPAIERAAAALFSDEDVPKRLKELAIPEAMHRRAAEEGRLWVAVVEEGGGPGAGSGAASPAPGTPVGFAHVTILDGEAHVFEIDVHPAHARRGVGTRLMRAVAEWAAVRGYAGVTLTTFRHLPWNAPFYARLGYREVATGDWTPGLHAQLQREAANGLDPSKRVAMRLTLATPPSPPETPSAPTTR